MRETWAETPAAESQAMSLKTRRMEGLEKSHSSGDWVMKTVYHRQTQ